MCLGTCWGVQYGRDSDVYASDSVDESAHAFTFVQCVSPVCVCVCVCVFGEGILAKLLGSLTAHMLENQKNGGGCACACAVATCRRLVYTTRCGYTRVKGFRVAKHRGPLPDIKHTRTHAQTQTHAHCGGALRRSRHLPKTRVHGAMCLQDLRNGHGGPPNNTCAHIGVRVCISSRRTHLQTYAFSKAKGNARGAC